MTSADFHETLKNLICQSTISLAGPTLAIDAKKNAKGTDIILTVSQKQKTNSDDDTFSKIVDKITQYLMLWIATEKIPSPTLSDSDAMKVDADVTVGWVIWQFSA